MPDSKVAVIVELYCVIVTTFYHNRRATSNMRVSWLTKRPQFEVDIGMVFCHRPTLDPGGAASAGEALQKPSWRRCYQQRHSYLRRQSADLQITHDLMLVCTYYLVPEPVFSDSDS